MPIIVSEEINNLREAFFRIAFREYSGWVCLGYIPTGRKMLIEEYFEYPQELPAMLEAINRKYVGHNVYFCPQLFKTKRRVKENVIYTPSAWADLDTCRPDDLLVDPTLVLETSPDRFQALWCFDAEVEPETAEEISKRIAYYHLKDGADKSGWDITQLLRVPATYNMKYENNPPEVLPIRMGRELYRTDEFEDYPDVPGSFGTFTNSEVPEDVPEADDVIEKYSLKLGNMFWPLYSMEPGKNTDWSKKFWQFLLLSFEAGMEPAEVLSVARVAKCNKFARDNRSENALWKDICRAEAHFEEAQKVIVPERAKSEPLLTDEERAFCQTKDTFVERYIRWASGLGDAATQYHQAGAFVALSSLLAGTVRLPTSFGTIIPNMWFMILADTTLTRKSTAMDIAMDLVSEVDPDSILATDGSIEGLMTSLSLRPGRPSIFLRDEFSGLLEAMTKKDYYAGMAETLTKLYDGKLQKRILRKEIIEVRDPVLVIFAGGIKNKVTSLLTHENVSSGFVPRFVFVTAESDASRVMPLGPPTVANLGDRDAILEELYKMYRHYTVAEEVTIKLTGAKITMPKRWNASMQPAAWVRYNKAEGQMMKVGLESEHPDIMTPVYDRLAKSALKAAVLIAASRQRNSDVVVEEQDMVHALYYAEQWREYSHEIVRNIGKGTLERELDKIYNNIVKHGFRTRSDLMRAYHLTARQADITFGTLEQRGLIKSVRKGSGITYWPTMIPASQKGISSD